MVDTVVAAGADVVVPHVAYLYPLGGLRLGVFRHGNLTAGDADVVAALQFEDGGTGADVDVEALEGDVLLLAQREAHQSRHLGAQRMLGTHHDGALLSARTTDGKPTDAVVDAVLQRDDVARGHLLGVGHERAELGRGGDYPLLVVGSRCRLLLGYGEVGKEEYLVAQQVFQAAVLADAAVDAPLGTHATGRRAPHLDVVVAVGQQLGTVADALDGEGVGTVRTELDTLLGFYPLAQEVALRHFLERLGTGVGVVAVVVQQAQHLAACRGGVARQRDDGQFDVGRALGVVHALQLVDVREAVGGEQAGGQFELPLHEQRLALLCHQCGRRLRPRLDLVALAVGDVGLAAVVVNLGVDIEREDILAQFGVPLLADVLEGVAGMAARLVGRL